MAESQFDPCTFSLPYMTATIGMRSDVKNLFTEVEKHGGYVTYREHKTWFETTYTHVRFEGPRWLMRAVIRILKQWQEVADTETDW